MSVKGDIQTALATRLGTIKTANGYGTDVAKIFVDDIPMGLDLEEQEIPAILIIGANDEPEIKHQCYHGNWDFELQLWHGEVTDSVMNDFVRDVAKAIWAGSPTTQTNGAFRGIHPAIYNVLPLRIESDLNMIEANRCYFFRIQVKFSTNLWDL